MKKKIGVFLAIVIVIICGIVIMGKNGYLNSNADVSSNSGETTKPNRESNKNSENNDVSSDESDTKFESDTEAEESNLEELTTLSDDELISLESDESEDSDAIAALDKLKNENIDADDLDAIYIINCNGMKIGDEVKNVAGDCIVFRSNGKWGIIDVGFGGVSSNSALEKQYPGISKMRAGNTLEQLQELKEMNGGELSFDFVMITHMHMDHGGNFSNVFSKDTGITMSEDCMVYVKEYEDNNPSYSDPAAESLYNNIDVYNGVLDRLQQRYGSDLDMHWLKSDFEPIQFEDFSLTFYNDEPEAAVTGKLNDNSIVTYFEHKNGTTALFMGDCEADQERRLMETTLKDVSNIDILKAGHHGLATSSSIEFLQQMNPSDILVTGSEGIYNEASDGSLLSKANQINAKIYTTVANENGITVTFDENEKGYTITGGFREPVAAIVAK